jgi:hypothetical protein
MASSSAVGDAESMANRESDRRESPRLNLQLNVEFLREGESRAAQRIGTSGNVSAGGIYFLADEWKDLKVGQELGIRLSGLSGYGTGPLFRSLRARATVLRVEKPREGGASGAKAGIAARFSERPYFEVYRWLE